MECDQDASVRLSPKLTPALTTSSHDTPFLHTPTKVDDLSELSSFLFPSRSFEVEQFSNIKDIMPEWEDDEVDEVMVLSPKFKIDTSLSVAHEAKEIPTSIPTISSFHHVHTLTSSSNYVRMCMAKHVETKKVYAIKTYTKSSISYDTPILEHAMKEQMVLRLLTQMNTPFVVKLRWSFQDREAMHIVTEHCDHGDLKSYFSCHGPLSESHAWILGAELAEAMSTLHSNGISHCSIRLDHILLDSRGHILLTGFSRSSFSTPNTPATDGHLSCALSNRGTSLHNIDQWSAPESALGWPQDCAIDMWGFGLVLWLMVTGKHPLLPQPSPTQEGNDHVRPEVLLSHILYAPPQLQHNNVDLCNLVSWCMQKNARLRPTAEKVKGHSYFANIDWSQLRKKEYPLNLKGIPTLEEPTAAGNALSDFPESETLRGVYIAGFNFGTDKLSRNQSGYDDSGCNIKTEDISHDFPDDIVQLPANHSAGEHKNPTALCKRTRLNSALESDYVTPIGSIRSDAKSLTTSEATSTGLYSCTSFGELRDCLTSADHMDNTSDAIDASFKEEQFQSNRAVPSSSAKQANESICRIHSSESDQQDGFAALTRQGSLPMPMPPSILRRDTAETLLSRSTSRLSSLGNATSTSRPPSAMSLGLGGARGLRLRKYASLNFDLDTVTSLDSYHEDEFQTVRPQSLRASRRVSFVDSLNDDLTRSKGANVAVGDVEPTKVGYVPPAPLSAPIGGGHAWNFMALNSLRATTSSQSTPLHSADGADYSGNEINGGQNKLKKKQRTTSTPALSTMMTPRLQDKVELPEGLKQIGLGIGYTHMPSRVASPHVSSSTTGVCPAPEVWTSPTARTPMSMAATMVPRRAVSIIGTTNAIQRCASIFAGLRSKQANTAISERRERMDALVERASEESDGLEAVMKEMYGASWTSEGGSPSCGNGESAGAVDGAGTAGGRKPGKVYTVSGSDGMSETLTRARGRSTHGSTLRLVDPMEDGGPGKL